MNWSVDDAAEIQRGALLRVVLALFTSLRILVGGTASKPTVLRRNRRFLWILLRPAEAATRRLIVIAARRMEIAPFDAVAAKLAPKREQGKPRFPLIDPRKDFGERSRKPKGPGPRITEIGVDRREPTPEKPLRLDDDAVDATRLLRRLRAIRAALEDIPAQARRLVAHQSALPAAKRLPPMRPGLPPGNRERGRHEVHDILRACHGLARLALDDLWRERQASGVTPG